MKFDAAPELDKKENVYDQAHFDERVKVEGDEAIKKGLHFLLNGTRTTTSGGSGTENPWQDGYLNLLNNFNSTVYPGSQKRLEEALRFANQQLAEVGPATNEIATKRPEAEKATIRAVMPSVIKKIEEKILALEKNN